MKKMILLTAAIIMAFAALNAQEKAGKKDTSAHINLYSCPMHPGVSTDKSGKCPYCGMDLNLSKKELLKTEVTKAYTCPIHADEISEKAGKCPKCGTQLNLSLKEKMKAEFAKVYTCPMHPDVASKEPGKCPNCGMALTVKQ
jgi:ssDNA-binding Zn-finger/Zn-ribbon topoisomerase 1